jgi:hypothetical protein
MEDFEYVTTETALPSAYKVAFLIPIANGDEARANAFAKRALELQRCLRGEDDTGNAMIEGLVKEP